MTGAVAKCWMQMLLISGAERVQSLFRRRRSIAGAVRVTVG